MPACLWGIFKIPVFISNISKQRKPCLFCHLGQDYLVTDLTESCAAFSKKHLQVVKHKSTVTASAYFTPAEVAEVYNTFDIDIVKIFAASNLLARFEEIDNHLWFTFDKPLVRAILQSKSSAVPEQYLYEKAVARLRHENRTVHAADILSEVRFCQMPGMDLCMAQMDPLVMSSPTLLACVAAAHYKYMQQELSREDFVMLPEWVSEWVSGEFTKYKGKHGQSTSTPGERSRAAEAVWYMWILWYATPPAQVSSSWQIMQGLQWSKPLCSSL